MGWAGHQDDQSGFRMQVSGLSLDVRCSRARQGPGSCASYRLPADSPSQTVGLGSSGQLRSLPGNLMPSQPQVWVSAREGLSEAVTLPPWEPPGTKHILKIHYLLSPLAYFFSFGSELALR